MRDQLLQYLIVMGGALVGVMARVGKWQKADGSLDIWKAAGECMTIPAIAYMVIGVSTYIDPAMDARIVGAVAALFGLLGVAAIEALALKYLNRRVDNS